MRWQFRRASTFQQQARLAVTLAWVAGYTNVVALVACGLAVSNLTATTTRVGESLGTGDLAAIGLLGWVLGWFLLGAFVSGLLAALARVKSYLDYGAYTPIQVAATAALNGPDDCIKEMRSTYRRRRDVLVESFGNAGWKFDPPAASMFAWVPIPEQFAAVGEG